MENKEKILFTSESVTEGHPDKICDAISDAILDALIAQDPMSRVACETATTTGLVLVMGEITSKANIDIQSIVRETIREIGYTRGKFWICVKINIPSVYLFKSWSSVATNPKN